MTPRPTESVSRVSVFGQDGSSLMPLWATALLRTELGAAGVGGEAVGGEAVGAEGVGGEAVGAAGVSGAAVGGAVVGAAVAAACKPVEVPSAYEPITPRVTRRSAPRESRTPRELLPSTLQGYRPMALRGESLA